MHAKLVQGAKRDLVRFARHLFPREQFGPKLNKIPFLAQLLDMHAFLYCNPGRRAYFAMVLGGRDEGSGKSVLMKGLAAAVHGQHNVHAIQAKELFSNFNAYEARTRFGVMDELQPPGRFDRIDGIRTSITEAQIRVVAKGKDGYTTDNRVTWLATTNFPLDAIPLSDTARRFWLEETPAPRMPEELAARVSPVDGLLAPGNAISAPGIGGALLRAYLHARHDAPGFSFNAWAKPPENEALLAAKRASIPREQELLEEALEPGGALARGFGTVHDIEMAGGMRGGYKQPAAPISREKWWRLFEAAAKAKGLMVTARKQPRVGSGARLPSYHLWYRDVDDLRQVAERFHQLKEVVQRGAPK